MAIDQDQILASVLHCDLGLAAEQFLEVDVKFPVRIYAVPIDDDLQQRHVRQVHQITQLKLFSLLLGCRQQPEDPCVFTACTFVMLFKHCPAPLAVKPQIPSPLHHFAETVILALQESHCV
ncbi:hypothetical protein RHE_PE00435 (plasmid) [Rhizobium etli CFN 42]|uniref:Uncharacterized protein n=1 Tax=Rhizobium etli (strain ATCC 51251 / DSM 11541 / JCM 21823 / NBRC 15573 / CFN 42) TaxID=347834 RepID=Q2JZX0_RHIEC|nr:hypothetical protein RHE_PE00435 [Rhizobium etli CFN 42]